MYYEEFFPPWSYRCWQGVQTKCMKFFPPLSHWREKKNFRTVFRVLRVIRNVQVWKMCTRIFRVILSVFKCDNFFFIFFYNFFKRTYSIRVPAFHVTWKLLDFIHYLIFHWRPKLPTWELYVRMLLYQLVVIYELNKLLHTSSKINTLLKLNTSSVRYGNELRK